MVKGENIHVTGHDILARVPTDLQERQKHETKITYQVFFPSTVESSVTSRGPQTPQTHGVLKAHADSVMPHTVPFPHYY